MTRILALAGVVLAAIIFAAGPLVTRASESVQELVARSPDGAIVVTIRDGTCTPEVAAELPPPLQEAFAPAVVVRHGVTYPACWSTDGNRVGVVLLQEGTIYSFSAPVTEFAPPDKAPFDKPI